MCTPGPDRAPLGVDVTRKRTTADLVAATDEGATSSSSTTASIPCYGDGTSGKRVQAVYAHAADVPDRFDELSPLLMLWAANVDAIFAESAAETGGIRHVRWATDPNCNLTVQRVQLSSTGDDSFSATVSELGSVGLNRTDRKYLVWTDATIYCGIANLYRDDAAGPTNRNNINTGYARTDSGCWGRTKATEAHELMHLLGGVQYTAPNTSGGGHCTDAYDRMCYSDAIGVTLTYPCDSIARGRLFDCNHEDYFSTSPPEGSYLATHWNTASSSYLEAIEPPAWSPTTSTPTPSPTPTPPSPEPTPTTSPSPSPTSSPPPAPTSTEVFTGTINRKAPSPRFSFGAGSGSLSASLSFSKGSALTLTLLDASGSTVATRTSGSPASLTATVPAGTFLIVVSGKGNTSFTLTVTYATP